MVNRHDFCRHKVRNKQGKAIDHVPSPLTFLWDDFEGGEVLVPWMPYRVTSRLLCQVQ